MNEIQIDPKLIKAVKNRLEHLKEDDLTLAWYYGWNKERKEQIQEIGGFDPTSEDFDLDEIELDEKLRQLYDESDNCVVAADILMGQVDDAIEGLELFLKFVSFVNGEQPDR